MENCTFECISQLGCLKRCAKQRSKLLLTAQRIRPQQACLSRCFLTLLERRDTHQIGFSAIPRRIIHEKCKIHHVLPAHRVHLRDPIPHSAPCLRPPPSHTKSRFRLRHHTTSHGRALIGEETKSALLCVLQDKPRQGSYFHRRRFFFFFVS